MSFIRGSTVFLSLTFRFLKRAGALEEPFTLGGTGDSDVMRLAVTVPRKIGLEGVDTGFPESDGGVAAEEVGVVRLDLEEVGVVRLDPEEGVVEFEPCFGLERVAITAPADGDFPTLGEPEGDEELPEFMIKLTNAVAEDGFGSLVLDAVTVLLTGIVFRVLLAVTDFAAVFEEGVMMVVPALRIEDALVTEMVGDLATEMVGALPDFSVRLACSLRVLSMRSLVVASCMATLAYES